MKVTKGKEFDYIVPGFGWMNIYDKQITKITALANRGRAPAPIVVADRMDSRTPSELTRELRKPSRARSLRS